MGCGDGMWVWDVGGIWPDVTKRDGTWRWNVAVECGDVRMSWDVAAWDRVERDRMGWGGMWRFGMGWDGIEWDGMGWDGTEAGWGEVELGWVGTGRMVWGGVGLVCGVI